MPIATRDEVMMQAPPTEGPRAPWRQSGLLAEDNRGIGTPSPILGDIYRFGLGAHPQTEQDMLLSALRAYIMRGLDRNDANQLSAMPPGFIDPGVSKLGMDARGQYK